MVGELELAGHACDRRVRMKSDGATPVARHCLPVLSGSAGYPLADGSGKTGGSLADRRCMLSG